MQKIVFLFIYLKKNKRIKEEFDSSEVDPNTILYA